MTLHLILSCHSDNKARRTLTAGSPSLYARPQKAPGSPYPREGHTHLAELGASLFFFHPAVSHEVIKHLSCKRRAQAGSERAGAAERAHSRRGSAIPTSTGILHDQVESFFRLNHFKQLNYKRKGQAVSQKSRRSHILSPNMAWGILWRKAPLPKDKFLQSSHRPGRAALWLGSPEAPQDCSPRRQAREKDSMWRVEP